MYLNCANRSEAANTIYIQMRNFVTGFFFFLLELGKYLQLEVGMFVASICVINNPLPVIFTTAADVKKVEVP